jgi:DNA-directed RNA polymerase specialized sigma24 family protein
VGTKFYCAVCRAQQCPECRAFAGRHGASCRYNQRRRRPPLTTVYGVTTADDLVALFNDAYTKAVSIARYVGDLNRPDAEDVVSDVFLYLWRKRDLLKAPPGRAYLFKAVEHGAIRARTHAWARRVVAMDPEDVVLAEQMTYDPTQPALAVPG